MDGVVLIYHKLDQQLKWELVNYCFALAYLISRVSRFEVAEYDPIFSDVHCKVSLELKGKHTILDKQRSKSTCQVLKESEGKNCFQN